VARTMAPTRWPVNGATWCCRTPRGSRSTRFPSGAKPGPVSSMCLPWGAPKPATWGLLLTLAGFRYDGRDGPGEYELRPTGQPAARA